MRHLTVLPTPSLLVGVRVIKQVENAAQRGLSVLRLLKPPSGTALIAAQLPGLFLILHREIFLQ